MSDLYDALSTAQQATFRTALFAKLTPGSCPTVDVSGITSADLLADAGNRAAAIDCFQTANNLTSGGVGILDASTYTAITGQAAPALAVAASNWVPWAIGGGVVLVGGIWYYAHHHKKRNRR